MNARRNRHAPVSLRVRGVQLLSQREHSVHELRQKLLRHARLLEGAVPAAANDLEAVTQIDGPRPSACAEDEGDGLGAAASGNPKTGCLPGLQDEGLGRPAISTRFASGDERMPLSAVHPQPQPESQPHRPAETVDETLAWLQSQGYLSDTRFVQSRVHVRAARFGNLRIRQELAQHQVVLTPEAECELRVSELNRAQSVCERKFGTAAPATSAEAAKRARFLMQRGFSSDVVRRVLRAAGKGAEDE